MNTHHTYTTTRKLLLKRMIFFFGALCLFLQVSYSQSYELRTYTFSNGASKVNSSSYILEPTVGQPISGTVSSANYTLTAGFLPTAIPRQAELTLQSSLNLSPTEIPPGGTTSLSFTLSNSGAVDVFAEISATVYLSANSDLEAGDLQLDQFSIVTNLAAGETFNFPQGSTTKSLEIPTDTEVGNYFVLVDLQTSVPIDEINANNVFSQQLVVSNTTTVDVTAPSVTSVSPSDIFTPSEEIIATITDASEIESATLFYRPISGTDFTPVGLTKNGNNFFVQLEDSWADEIGLEGYIIASDVFGNTIEENPNTHFFLYRETSSTESIPFVGGGFDGKAASYRMFSVPYELDDKSLVSIFDELGGYDQNVWRVFHYSNSQYNELLDGLNNIALGDGYWFNTTVPDFSIEIGSGTTDNVSQSNPFQRNFEQGWNQIGNPYPFAITWADIQSANPDLGLGSLQTYQNGSYQTSTTLNAWEGAFVFCETAGSGNFPIRPNTSGRESGNDDFEWKLNFTLELKDKRQSGVVGMHRSASLGKDGMDEITVPRFISFLEMSTHHPEYFAPKFSSDIVPTSDNHEWLFTLESDETVGTGILSWNLTSNFGSYFLLNHSTLKVIDMSQVSQIAFEWGNGKQFSIYYSKDGDFIPNQSIVGQVYPNPFTDRLMIPLLTNDQDQSIAFQIIDTAGKEIINSYKSFNQSGLHLIEWDGKDVNGHEVSNGVYFFRISLNGQERMVRIIKNKVN
ncbi:T9SS type A sorting domain-containing protein [Ekhidna sp.]